MKILLTNDDGYDAEGIVSLYEALKGEHELCMVAPSGNRSGASSSFSPFQKHFLRKHSEGMYSLDGTPVDCILSALKGKYLPFVPDVVLSGINRGGNLGTDIMYSGTCGAARQACLAGIPAVALSCEYCRDADGNYIFDYRRLAEFASKNLSALIAHCGTEDERKHLYPYFVNVNAPSGIPYRGIKFASISQRIYHDKVNITQENDENLYSTCIEGGEVSSVGDEGCDALLIQSGFLAVSCVYTEPVADLSFCGKGTSQFIL